MSALTHDFDLQLEVAPPAELDLELPLAPDFARKWDAIHADAAEIARLGQLGRERQDERIVAFPRQATLTHSWNRKLAARALDDLAAVLSPGLTALRSIEAEGRDPTAAAVALWQEFHRTRATLLDLVAARPEEKLVN